MLLVFGLSSPPPASLRDDEHVAVKIVKNIKCFREVAKSEMAVLEEINGLDDDRRL